MSHRNSVWHRRTGEERRVGWRRWSVHWLCFPSQSRVALNILYTQREVTERKIVNVSVKQKGSMRWGIERIQLRPPTNEAQRRAKKLASRLRSLWRFWFVLYSRYTRYPKKYFTQTYRDLYGDAMLVLTWMSSNMRWSSPHLIPLNTLDVECLKVRF